MSRMGSYGVAPQGRGHICTSIRLGVGTRQSVLSPVHREFTAGNHALSLDIRFPRSSEEVDELAAAHTTESLLEEAADVLEVLSAIAVERGAALATIVDIARVKRDERGGFDLRLWLDGVDPQP